MQTTATPAESLFQRLKTSEKINSNCMLVLEKRETYSDLYLRYSDDDFAYISQRKTM